MAFAVLMGDDVLAFEEDEQGFWWWQRRIVLGWLIPEARVCRLEHAPHQAAIHAQSSAVDAGGDGAAEEGDEGGDFLGTEEALDQGGGAILLHETTAGFLDAEAGEEVLHELGDAFGEGGAGHDGIDGD